MNKKNILDWESYTEKVSFFYDKSSHPRLSS